MISISTEIHTLQTDTDQNGNQVYIINNCVHYQSKHWTLDEAIRDYLDPESAERRALDEWSMWVD